jgi:hypothetical protein
MSQRQYKRPEPDRDDFPAPRPTPQSILDVADPTLRQRAIDLFRNASLLFRLIDRQRAWFYDLKSNGRADPGLAIRLNWATRACVGALVDLDFFAVSVDEILALFPGPPSGVLARKGLTEEDKAIEGQLRIRVPIGHRGDPVNWYEDESYIMNGIIKLHSLYDSKVISIFYVINWKRRPVWRPVHQIRVLLSPRATGH